MLLETAIFADIKNKMKKLKIWELCMKIGNICGCHQRADRSFFIRGYQFPLCARCTGLWFGYMASIILQKLFLPPIWLCMSFLLIMFIDWLLQYRNISQSTNLRRLITGILCGYGLLALVIIFIGGIING